MAIEIGALTHIVCPSCGQTDTFEITDSNYDMENDILIMENTVYCNHCDSSFNITQRFLLDFLDCNISSIEKHHKETSGMANCPCPPNVFLCNDCPYDETELCPFWDWGGSQWMK